ncbi:hypothetical protein EIN_074350 [Entamoeba invadens IP1]|uniref:Uncharacterized protein n=1 Tax=Entamoeba invadens IP1 TaxID=370355 RepID=A0A0A1UBR0_ENTIV|nr:hypothetical protein EIN_074350 [Entamoeba invadens IP1]ELP92592.1 hypothetical protein EIN_074350 [Entamoeba invadens IP1]|eukprot:XP_004259363.1 hypothetical protein EIN_074350 [Entamoeba invadens IP1]
MKRMDLEKHLSESESSLFVPKIDRVLLDLVIKEKKKTRKREEAERKRRYLIEKQRKEHTKEAHEFIENTNILRQKCEILKEDYDKMNQIVKLLILNVNCKKCLMKNKTEKVCRHPDNLFERNTDEKMTGFISKNY